MDPSRRDRNGRLIRGSSSQNSTTPQHGRHSSAQGVRSQSYMSAAAPPQWQDIPLPRRPQDFERYQHTTVPSSLYQWRLRSSEERSSNRSTPRPPELLSNRHGFPEADTATQGMQPSPLHPRTSPRLSRLNAPDNMDRGYRAVSQPNTPFIWHDGSSSQEIGSPSVSLLPRAPTYPPATTRRARSATNLPDSTFDDITDFHLFAQATAGLGPEQALRPLHSSSSDSSEDGDVMGTYQQGPDCAQHISPIQETPTTLYALQHLAQMPQSVHAMESGDRDIPQMPASQGQSELSARDFSWIHPPDEIYDEDEELPDYAMSQAQAQAEQRIEATRRAQELQRRWQQSR